MAERARWETKGGGLRKFTRQRTDQTLTYYHSSLFQSTTLAAAQVLPQEEALNVGDKGQQDGEGAAPAPPAGGYLPYCKPDSELFIAICHMDIEQTFAPIRVISKDYLTLEPFSCLIFDICCFSRLGNVSALRWVLTG